MQMGSWRIVKVLTGLFVLSFGPGAAAQSLEEQTVQSASAVLSETMAIPGSAIPLAMLENAHGVAIIPKVIKGSFVIGARHGRGVLCVRDPNGVWHAPVFITLTGGNVGWQIGLQSTDIVLVFKTQKSVDGLLSGKLTLGADAAAAAGPVGRQTSVATDGRLQAEVYSYSRSRGLFAGVSIDGSVIRVDQMSTGSYYQAVAPGQPPVVPASAQQLTQTIANLTRPGATAQPQNTAQPGQPGTYPANPAMQQQSTQITQQYAIPASEVLRGQLAQTAPELFELLTPEWRGYLALPEEVFSGSRPADLNRLRASIQRYDTIALEPRFRELAARPEFQSVYGLLKHYEEALDPSTPALNLPPPPGAPPAVLPASP